MEQAELVLGVASALAAAAAGAAVAWTAARRSGRRSLTRLREALRSPSWPETAGRAAWPPEVRDLAVSIDLAEGARRTALKGELEAATARRLERAAARLAHDIRSPLAAIEVFLSAGPVSPELRAQVLGPALARLRSIADLLSDDRLIEEVLAAPVPERGAAAVSVDAEPQPVMVSALIESVVAALRLRPRIGPPERIRFEEADSPYGLFAHLAPRPLRAALEDLGAALLSGLGGDGSIRFTIVAEGERVTCTLENVDRTAFRSGEPSAIRAGSPGAAGHAGTAADRSGRLPAGQGGADPLRGAAAPLHTRSDPRWEEVPPAEASAALGDALTDPLARVRGLVGAAGGNVRVLRPTDRPPSFAAFEGAVSLTIPLTPPPSWFPAEIVLSPERPVVVVDDDQWVHPMWEKALRAAPGPAPEIVHLYSLEQLESRLRETEGAGRSELLLVDDSYLASDRSGLDLLEQHHEAVAHAVLVTGRWDEPQVRSRSLALGLRLLPKSLVSRVPIRSGDALVPAPLRGRPDAVLVDDHVWIRKGWELSAARAGKRLLTCRSMRELLAIADQLDRSTVLFLDSDLRDEMPGEQFAWSLFDAGFTEIYLATGFDAARFSPMPWLRGIIGKDPPDWSRLDRRDDDPVRQLVPEAGS